MSDQKSCSNPRCKCGDACACGSKCACGCCSCPITGINFSKKFFVGSLIMVVWTNMFSWLWHGKVLGGRYMETASLWRSQDEMSIRCWAITLGISLSAIIATHIFYKGYEGKGMGEGIRFGLIISLLFSGMLLVTYATQPIPNDILGMWFLGDLVSYSLGAMFLALHFNKGKCSASCEKNQA